MLRDVARWLLFAAALAALTNPAHAQPGRGSGQAPGRGTEHAPGLNRDRQDQGGRHDDSGWTGDGLRAEWFWESRTLRRLSDVDWSRPDLVTTERLINWPKNRGAWFEGAPADRFAVRLRGTIEIPQPGRWRFWLYSDDGSDLSINRRRVVNNDGLHSMRMRDGRVELEAGSHEIEVRFFENRGHAGLVAYWQGPGMRSREVIPPAAFGPVEEVGGALANAGFHAPITQANQWRANDAGLGAWFGRDFESSGGVARLTRAANNWQGRVLLQAVPMPKAGTFRYTMRARYSDYYTQLHFWHILAAQEGAVVGLHYPQVRWDFRNPKAVSVHREYSRPGQEGDPWHIFEGEFTVSHQVASTHDYLVFAIVASMRPGQFAEIDSVLLDLSRLREEDASTLADRTTDSADRASSPLVADLTGDGRPDVVLTGRWPALLVHQPDGTLAPRPFVSAELSRQAGLADFDGDGLPDLWASNHPGGGRPGLLWNRAASGFESAPAPSLGFRRPVDAEGLALADFDADGWCDVVQFATNGNWVGLNGGQPPEGENWAFEAMERGDTGLSDVGAAGDGDFVSSADVNGDGRPDFFYHYSGGRLFLSQPDGGWAEARNAITVPTGPGIKFGSAWGDYNGDGRPDLVVPSTNARDRVRLFRQNADGTFADVAAAAGLPTSGSYRSAAWGDHDNDGLLDLLLVGAGDTPHALYINQGDGTFAEEANAIPVSGDGADALFVDYDNDGDLDLLITHINGPAKLLTNSTNTDRYLKVRLVGAGPRATNTLGVGVRVDLLDAAGNMLATRHIGAARGFGGQEPLWAHFGGVEPTATYNVRVHFNTGTLTQAVTPALASTTIGGNTIAQMVTITEPEPGGLRLIQWQETDPGR